MPFLRFAMRNRRNFFLCLLTCFLATVLAIGLFGIIRTMVKSFCDNWPWRPEDENRDAAAIMDRISPFLVNLVAAVFWLAVSMALVKVL